MIDKAQVFISVQRALLFNILKSLRFIFVKYGVNRIDLVFISDKELTDDERDIYYAVSSEIDGDFSEIKSSSVTFVESNLELSTLDYEKFGIYSSIELIESLII
jgi:hypothetical protein